jgi:glycosyltransferase involved in cell wall biosynthesis
MDRSTRLTKFIGALPNKGREMLENPPLISVLIPIFNVENYLVECLESVANQTFTDFEVICINDGSTDGSRDIIASYLKRDPRFSVIDKPNSGYGASMNRGLDAASGTYIAILESDDFFEPDTLENLYRIISEYDAEVVKASYYLYWSGVPAVDEKQEIMPLAKRNMLINPQIDHEPFYLPPSVWSAIYRRDFIMQNDIRFNETPGASYQDTAWAFKIWFNATRAVLLDDAWLHYRQDNAQSSVKSAAKVYCVVDEYTEIERYLDTREVPPWLPALKTRLKFGTYIWNHERIAEEFQLDFTRFMSKEFRLEREKGNLDWALFDDWNRAKLELILDSPDKYQFYQVSGEYDSKVKKAILCIRIGGFSLLAKVIRDRYFTRRAQSSKSR